MSVSTPQEGQLSFITRYDGVAILVPCLNEEKAIAKVVADFTDALPGAKVLVFDNNSTDKTAIEAKNAGATVISSPLQGKGNVVKHMFDQVDAEIYVLVDGDDTYPASAARELVAEFGKGGGDMIVGVRTSSSEEVSYRRFHRFGNRLVAGLISRLFSINVTDVMSGYRVLSRDFVKSVPLKSQGFEIETELTLQAANKGFTIKEYPVHYGTRPEGSFSKLNTFSDGYFVLKAIFLIFKDYKPLIFFSALSMFLLIITLLAGSLPITEYFTTGYVYRLPLAVLATGTGILSVLSLAIGLILDTISKYHNENFQMLRRLVKK